MEFLLLLLGGAALVMATAAARRSNPASVNPALPAKSDDKSPVATGDKAKAEDPCIYGPDKPIDQLPDGIKNAIVAALTVESDPAALDDFATQLDKMCQPTAATALRNKAAALRAMGVPPGFDPSSTDVVSIPIPGIDSAPAVPDDLIKPDGDGGLGDLSPEMSTMPTTGAGIAIPRIGCRSSLTTQWWSGPMKEGDSIWKLAKDITGNGERYVELMAANPEKKTVGDPLRPFATGYSFVTLKVGERIRIPRTWNVYVDETGRVVVGGKILAACPASDGTIAV